MVIVQIDPKEDIDSNDYTNFSVFDRRNYGDTRLIFFELISPE
jgi:hypothetical protein